MAVDFYTEWLEVPPGVRPPDHYTLLGLRAFCDDKVMIEQAARKRLARLDRYGIHPDPKKRETCHRLMNEVARARVVLATPSRKRAYDQDLAAARGLAPPEAADNATAAEPVSSEAEGTEAEAYLQDLAQAAQGAASANRIKTRPTPAPNRAPLYVAGIFAVILIGIVVWAVLRPSNSPTNPQVALVKQTTSPTTALPIPHAVGTESPRIVAAPAPPRVLPVTPGVPPKPVAPASTAAPVPAPQPPRVSSPKSTDPLVAINASIDTLTDWTVGQGIWSFVEPGKLRGEGPSNIDFDPDLPADTTVSFRLCVVKGMRPRIYFDGPEIYVGNEGYSKKITIHGKVNELEGDPIDYNNGDEIAVRVKFIGADRIEVHLNDHVLTGVCQPHAKIHLRLSGGDGWSKGTTDFWDMHVGNVTPAGNRPTTPITKPPPVSSPGPLFGP